VNLILVGHRGSGKSTVGSLVAKRLGWRFVDLDQVIATQTGKTIREMFVQDGEAEFRARERQALQGLRKARNCVIALGGGTLGQPENRSLARRLGRVVWLRAPAIVLWSRIKGDRHKIDTRPDLTPAGGLTETEAKVTEREPAYRSVAHHIVDTVSTTPEAVADAIELWFRAGDAGQE
jgi:shikimate kinase